MFIKEICLEGFKSYATRTVVPGFDPLFNAITGLNGSGKSNILDSICFVLGITNLQQVRASNLQELVYKQGQAGVTKATVSVLFDNSDSSHSPIGYEDCAEITVTRQIVVGGRNKYMINGHLAQPNRVQNLFHSVQLNVNNPHFLIMQGRITKVLNMKPPETLSMLEEAAGTRMYENKKEAALKTLEKKQSKVDEIDNVLAQELLPALEKLRKERAVYMEWSHNKEEIRNLQRFCIAYDFVEAEKVKNTAVGEVEQLKNGIGQQKEQMVQLQEEVAEKEGAISALRQQKETVTTENLKQLIDKVDKVSKALVKETCAFDNLNEALDTEKASQQQLERTMADLEQAVAEKTSGFQRADDSVSGLKEKVDTLVKNSAQLEGELQGVRLGKSGHGADKSLADQLADAKAAASRAENEIQQARTKTHHLERELKDKKEHLLSKENEAMALARELEARKDEVGNLKVALQDVGYREGSMETLEKARMEKTEAVQKLKQEISELSGRLGGVQFSYDNPTRDFDRHRVKGVVARLFHVKDAKAMTALEVAAGGKLFQVVVDNEVTGKLLFEKGGLRRRVTIIPLNKIQGNTINHRAQSAADKVVGYGNAKVALSLIGYDEELQAAMAYVFGGSFVCSDSDTAKQVAFHRDIRVTSVTLEGDVFQPSGLLTGGSRNGGGELLMRLHALAEAEHKLAILLQKLVDIEQQVSSLLPLHRQYSSMKAQLELKTYDLTLCETRATQSEHHKLNELVQAMEMQLEREVLEASTKEQHHTDCLELLATIQQSINEHGRDRDTRISSLEIKIKAVKLELAAAVKELKAMESTRERLLMENEAAVQEKLSLATQLSSMQANIEALTVQRSTLSSKIEALKNEYDRIQDEISESRSKIEECDTEIGSMSRSLSRLQQSMTDCSLNIKKIENQVKRMEEAHNVSAKTVDDLLKKHDWISSEKQFFAKPGTAYDFSVRNPVQAKEQLESRRTEQEKVEKMINKKAMNMFQKAEEDYNELMKKKGIIENDKQKIQSVIRELDEKKKEALEVTWQKVNKDFGSIFSTLLPGTTAKLEPPEGGDFLEGLEVRVAFGGVWKQSLSELSGGQRSLLALSLILSLLLFKPAPLYILDEVDAALDLSHTQNIGRMIKSHFPQSQFIVVSLKEGMFTNANVIFRTKFVDGVSTVTRTVPGR